MKVARSKTGLPTITENGGGMTNTGYATIVCGPQGQALKPLFIPRGYSNSDHAIFVVKPGLTHLIHSSIGKWGESCQVKIVTEINDQDEIKTETVAEYENGDGNIPSIFQAAANAALTKAKCYHCREAHFIKE